MPKPLSNFVWKHGYLPAASRMRGVVQFSRFKHLLGKVDIGRDMFKVFLTLRNYKRSLFARVNLEFSFFVAGYRVVSVGCTRFFLSLFILSRTPGTIHLSWRNLHELRRCGNISKRYGLLGRDTTSMNMVKLSMGSSQEQKSKIHLRLSVGQHS